MPVSSKKPNNLSHLFQAAQRNPEVSGVINNILSKKRPITILLEGSAYLVNIDTLDSLISQRKQPKDSLVLVDINASTVSSYVRYIQKQFPDNNYRVICADMNSLPCANNSIDLIIHNFTINFNITNRDDDQTLLEIKRVLKPARSACLFSVGILIRPNKMRSYSSFSGVAVLNESKSYYESLFLSVGLRYNKFDSSKNTSTFPYNRYILQPYEATNPN